MRAYELGTIIILSAAVCALIAAFVAAQVGN
jgi:hypothetical protein